MKDDVLTRAVKIRLVHATESKQRTIRALLESYRGAVNFYVKSLWNERGKLDKETFDRLQNSRLSERYKSQALKQALEIVVFTKKAILAINKNRKRKRRIKNVPRFEGVAILDAKFVDIVKGDNSFDYWLRLSTLKKGKRIRLPITATQPMLKWLAIPSSQLKQGCGLGIDSDGVPFVILWIEMPKPAMKQRGADVGMDAGINKLMTFSDGKMLGLDLKPILDKIDRQVKGSKGKQRSYAERDNYIGQTLNQIPFDQYKTIVVEDLKGIKHGKKKKPWQNFQTENGGVDSGKVDAEART